MSEPNQAARLAEPPAREPDVPAPDPSGRRADLLAVAVAVALVAAATAVGLHYNLPNSGVVIFVSSPPLFADWLPHVGPGSVFAVLIAAAVVLHGPALAARLPWRRALAAGYLASLAWIFSLAMVDGWVRGFAGRLTIPQEYLHEVPGITDIPRMLREFSSRILDFQPDSWTTHVSGHPPGATLVFVWLDRIGLHGGAWAATAVVLAGSLVAVAVPATVALLGRAEAARAVLPFAVLTPGAVWIGVSADGLFAGTTATGLALLALSAKGFSEGRRYAVPAGSAAGALLGFGIFLSYGLVLLGLLAVTVAVLGRQWRAAVLATAAALVVVGLFAWAGFWWLDGYHLVVERYYQGVALVRPYSYWVWADLAAVAVALGPAVVAALPRGLTEAFLPRPRRAVLADPVLLLGVAALLTMVFADVSGLSKAETERIWLPFGVWLLPMTALLPRPGRRWWLAAQAGTALAVNHLLLTGW
jgi:methylthioxylose transferase